MSSSNTKEEPPSGLGLMLENWHHARGTYRLTLYFALSQYGSFIVAISGSIILHLMNSQEAATTECKILEIREKVTKESKFIGINSDFVSKSDFVNFARIEKRAVTCDKESNIAQSCGGEVKNYYYWCLLLHVILHWLKFIVSYGSRKANAELSLKPIEELTTGKKRSKGGSSWFLWLQSIYSGFVVKTGRRAFRYLNVVELFLLLIYIPRIWVFQECRGDLAKTYSCVKGRSDCAYYQTMNCKYYWELVVPRGIVDITETENPLFCYDPIVHEKFTGTLDIRLITTSTCVREALLIMDASNKDIDEYDLMDVSQKLDLTKWLCPEQSTSCIYMKPRNFKNVYCRCTSDMNAIYRSDVTNQISCSRRRIMESGEEMVQGNDTLDEVRTLDEIGSTFSHEVVPLTVPTFSQEISPTYNSQYNDNRNIDLDEKQFQAIRPNTELDGKLLEAINPNNELDEKRLQALTRSQTLGEGLVTSSLVTRSLVPRSLVTRSLIRRSDDDLRRLQSSFVYHRDTIRNTLQMIKDWLRSNGITKAKDLDPYGISEMWKQEKTCIDQTGTNLCFQHCNWGEKSYSGWYISPGECNSKNRSWLYMVHNSYVVTVTLFYILLIMFTQLVWYRKYRDEAILQKPALSQRLLKCLRFFAP